MLLFLLSLSLSPAFADEGMWLPQLLKRLNEPAMKANGMRLSAEDIYSINQSSLKDAVVSFGGFCTGEVISDQGLLLTNLHCGLGQVQFHSTVEKDYITDGFWAENKKAELPNDGLTATFIRRIENVTQPMLEGTDNALSPASRDSLIGVHQKVLEEELSEKYGMEVKIRDFFYGAEFYAFVTETFTDVRLVGAPPRSIGNFGGDTDNWMWPRHAADFSLFRIYAGPDNRPAKYSQDNQPYRPKKHFPISLRGPKEGDFTMVFGFPGRTSEYLYSEAVRQIMELQNPANIDIRGRKLAVLETAMRADDKVRIKYTAKQARVSNAWKKWIGQNRGLKKLDAVRVKQQQEVSFEKWILADAGRREKYGQVLPTFQENYSEMAKILLPRDYFYESILGSDLGLLAYRYYTSLSRAKDQQERTKAAEELEARLELHFKDYDLKTDKELFIVSAEAYRDNVEPRYYPPYLAEVKKKYKDDIRAYADDLYKRSALTDKAKAKQLLEDVKAGKIKSTTEDPAYMFLKQAYDTYITDLVPAQRDIDASLDANYMLYVKGLREMYEDLEFYPDANSTMRVAFGQVKSYSPRNGVKYNWYTTQNGLLEKISMDHVPDYVVPERLVKLFESQDFGPYAADDGLHICFIASNHTTGGNSGSPVIDADGRLIGTNFDRNWEGTMSDIMYDPNQVRNISVDIRYILFIIDKYAGAGHLVEEMTLVTE